MPPFETKDIKTTYQRIKMNAYSFPDHVELSPDAKALINKIFVKDPAFRPSLDEILTFSFFTKNTIPKSMPLSSLAIPPSANFLKLLLTQDDNQPLLSSRALKTENNKDCKENQCENNENQEKRENKKIAVISCFEQIENGPDVWVKKWVDYSSKYGIGYLLNNSCVGVYFNDGSKIISDCSGVNFKYQERGSIEEISFKADLQPQEYRKKVSLVEHFRKHLITDPPQSFSLVPKVFVKKFISTQHASFFRLSNKIVQVKFMDRSELILCSRTKHIVYINKNSETLVHPLNTALESGIQDLTKRLRYTKEVLTTMETNDVNILNK